MFIRSKNINQAKADIRDGALVLYMPDAVKPCVWRMDLDMLSETSIEIDEVDNDYILATKDINGVVKPIASFHLKAKAQEALYVTLNALMKGTDIKKYQATQKDQAFIPPRNGLSWGKILGWGLVALIVLFIGWLIVIPTPTVPITNNVAAPVSAPDNNDTGYQPGVPIDVDDLFNTDE